MLRVKYLHAEAWHLSSSERRNVRCSAHRSTSPLFCQVMLLLACSDFTQQSFKRALRWGDPFLISGYAKERLLSTTLPGGWAMPVCGSMRLVEGRSGPAFTPDHPLMLQRSNPVWTNWDEPGVARGPDRFTLCLLDIFSISTYIYIYIYIYECNLMSRLHSLFEGHCIIFRGVELGGTLGTCTYQYLATTNQAVPCNNFDQIIKYIYMFF